MLFKILVLIHNRNQNSREKIEEMLETFELLDPWRTCFSNGRNYTWRQSSPIKQSRLDYFLVSEDLFSLMKNTKIIPGYKTDHSAITFTFSASLARRGKGYWKFNSQLLREFVYVEKVKTCIKENVSEYYLSGDINDLLNVELTCNDQVFFEILKMKIRSISISHSITKTREEKDLTLKLEKDILNLEDIMNSAPSELIQSSLNNKNIEFERKREEKVEGILLLSKANWHENGEKGRGYTSSIKGKLA